MPGLSVDFAWHRVSTLQGARDSLGGIPGMGVQLEPDEEIGYYTVEGVRLYDIPLDMSILGLEFKYIDEGDMAQDVSQKVAEILDDRMGI